jgi:TRAP-type C4-dicarboxylate transport system substrate-binding protein
MGALDCRADRPGGGTMGLTARRSAARASAAAVVLLAATLGARAAEDKPYVMKISTATVGEAQHQFAKDYAAAIEKDSGGRIKTEIYPASQLGPVQQQAEGVQFGAIQCQIVPPEFLAGIDERFELLTAPALVTSIQGGQRLAANPAVSNLMLGLGADKGLHGVALFMVGPSVIVSRKPISHLADFKGMKIRIFASQFQRVAMQRLGAVPKPMTLGEVLPALQDNALDGAVSAVTVLNSMQFVRVAKYVTEIDQPAIFGVAELSEKWYDTLPADLRQIVDRDATATATALDPWVIDFNTKARQAWTASGGQLINLPPDEQAAMLRALASVGADVSKTKPRLATAYKIITDAAK